mmetsp:Transcript_15626/g.32161  ORF Transcript_15626/g.32161 Transcript_15626/m.32161 type:complete len:140 (-) Transcript_15626:146-565(-)|eukprot:CAMPEP_0118649884 /NCGR_PEP_ID=MMETSP0785-20121206/9943_1 /TAXON_ID=91992 /ORGANISM="Bolidomonas pacifica, Strain CCMP 1866" /LENGTH=139 /DNA_ID=CAMNT_0006542205 /DNA_START=60 /DNA_END=479 /DNA_ORIENTATION=-
MLTSRLAPRLAPRALFFSTVTKTTTGLVGLPVHPDPIPALISANQAVLERLKEIPHDAGYRINAEKVANFRISKAQDSNGDIESVEKAIACGQIEELIRQAEDEMEVVEMFINDKLWEDMRPTEVVKKVEGNEGEEEGK